MFCKIKETQPWGDFRVRSLEDRLRRPDGLLRFRGDTHGSGGVDFRCTLWNRFSFSGVAALESGAAGSSGTTGLELRDLGSGTEAFSRRALQAKWNKPN